MNSHELTIYLVGGLAITVSGLVSVLLSWVRTDIRNLAEAVAQERQETAILRQSTDHLTGIMRGKGII